METMHKLGYLLSLEFVREFDERNSADCSVKVVLCNASDDCEAKTLLNFTGVIDLKVGDLERLVKNDVRITDISDHQMEGVRYRVKEEENETFSFYCSSFCCEVVEPKN